MTPLKSQVRRIAAQTLKRLYRNSPPHPICVPYAYTGDGFDEVELLLGTKTGLFHLKDGSLNKLLSGRTYGITKVGERWYAAVNRKISLGKKLVTRQGYLVSFFLDGKRLEAPRVEWCPLDTSVHQIDYWGSWLFVTDTANNRILRFDATVGKLAAPTAFYPNGYLQNGRQSENYAHINSIYSDGITVYLMCHNDSKYTGRDSQIAMLDLNLNLLGTQKINAQCAHNVISYSGKLHFCDSSNGRFWSEGKVISEFPVYLRGLARSKAFWVAGGSDFSNRSRRGLSTGHLFLVSDAGQIVAEMRVPEMGSVYEVRFVNEPDLGLSQFASHVVSTTD